GLLRQYRIYAPIQKKSAIVPLLNFAQPPREKSALGVIRDQRERSRIALRCFLRGSQAAQQISPRGVQQVVAVEVAGSGQRLDEGERRARAVHHGDRRGAVEGDDGGRMKALQKSVEAKELGPDRIFRQR